ncbi:MAG: hypothetical protein WA057_02165 [Candidatus Magasanikiibacteriota bacterium]
MSEIVNNWIEEMDRWSPSPSFLRQKIDYMKEANKVRNPDLLEGKVVDFMKEQGLPSAEVSDAYVEQKELLTKLFGDADMGLKSDLFFHGTGLLKYEGEKYGKGGEKISHRKVVSVLDNVLQNGLVPHHDLWLPTKDVETVSLAANYFYAKWYADKYMDPENCLEWQLGDPIDWFNFTMADIVKDEISKIALLRKRVDWGSIKEMKKKRKDGSSNLLYDWVSSLNSNLLPRTPVDEILRCHTDIFHNWGAVLCVDAGDIKEIDMPHAESHEVRTDQKVEPFSIRAIGVPLKHVDEAREMVGNSKLKGVEIFALECADLHLAAFPFKELTKRYK